MGLAYSRFTLEIETDGDARIKLIWTAHGDDDSFLPKPAYFVSSGLLMQAAEEVRKVLRRLATLDNPADLTQYQTVLQDLRDKATALHSNLLPTDGEQTAFEIANLIYSDYGNLTIKPRLFVIIRDERLSVPWSFVCFPESRGPTSITAPSLEDYGGFWLTHFQVTTRYQGGQAFSSTRLQQGAAVCAFHKTLFADAEREAIRRKLPIKGRVDKLAPKTFISNTWTRCRESWKHIAETHDSVLYVFGHSDGEVLYLGDGESSDYALPASSISSYFHKTRMTSSASIFILNGCRTAVPEDRKSWPVGFLKATTESGFFGFIGCEVPIPNDFAFQYGGELLIRMVEEGMSLGEAFDALREEDSLFPRSLLYSCFAQRSFRLPAIAEHVADQASPL